MACIALFTHWSVRRRTAIGFDLGGISAADLQHRGRRGELRHRTARCGSFGRHRSHCQPERRCFQGGHDRRRRALCLYGPGAGQVLADGHGARLRVASPSITMTRYATAIAVGPDLDSEHLVFRLEPDSLHRGPGDRRQQRSRPKRDGAPLRKKDRGWTAENLSREPGADRRPGPLPHRPSCAGNVLPGSRSAPVVRAERSLGIAKGTGQFRRRCSGRAGGGGARRHLSAHLLSRLAGFGRRQPHRAASGRARTRGCRYARGSGPASANSHWRQSRLGTPAAVRCLPWAARLSRECRSAFSRDIWILSSMRPSPARSPAWLRSWAWRRVTTSSRCRRRVPATKASDSRGWYQEIDLAGDAELNAGDAPAFATVSGSVSFPGRGQRAQGRFSPNLESQRLGEFQPVPSPTRGRLISARMPYEPGRYNVSLDSSQGFFLGKLSATGARLIGRTLEIGGASSVHFVGVATRGVGQVDGVALRDGQPFAGAMIVLVPHDPAHNSPLFRRDQSDSDGTFTLPNVVPGQYTVVAIANGWDLEWGNPAALQPYLERGEAVQVASRGQAANQSSGAVRLARRSKQNRVRPDYAARFSRHLSVPARLQRRLRIVPPGPAARFFLPAKGPHRKPAAGPRTVRRRPESAPVQTRRSVKCIVSRPARTACPAATVPPGYFPGTSTEMALPSPATAPSMRKIGDVIVDR